MQDEEMGFENTTPSRDSLSGPYGTASDSGDVSLFCLLNYAVHWVTRQ